MLSSAALGLTVFGIVQAPEVGWGSTQTVLVLAGAAVLAAAFVASQRVVREPLVPLGVFRVRNLTAGNVALLLLGAAWVPMWFVANLYLRQVLDMSAFEAGAALLPMTLLIVFVMVGGIGRIIGRFGTKAPLVLGMTILASGLALFSLADANGSYVSGLPVGVAGRRTRDVAVLRAGPARPACRRCRRSRAASRRGCSARATRSGRRSAWPS